MIRLIPMNKDRYDTFIEISKRDQIQGQVRAGYWKPEERKANMEKMENQLIPLGLHTQDHYFYAIEIMGSDIVVGGLWYMVTEQDGQRVLFVVDIQVYPTYRRRGYGTDAFRITEDHASEMGISSIVLNVFEHNQAAKAMYEKLGYVGSGTTMTKELSIIDKTSTNINP